VIEELPEKGIVKYAKPAGVIAALVPVTSPYVTPIGIAIYAIKCKDAVIFSPHPASRNTTTEAVRVMRAALRRAGAPEDLLQSVERPSIPLARELMETCDLTIATGGPAMVKAAYGSGKPAYGVGAGNATMVIDETADVAEAARNTRMSKTNDHGSGCSADGNLVVDDSIYDAFLAQLQAEGGYLVNDRGRALRRLPMGCRRASYGEHHARPAPSSPGCWVLHPEDKTFSSSKRDRFEDHPFSTESWGPLAVHIAGSTWRRHGGRFRDRR
jgi:sulfoacetaldehyde dehydrogenase